MNMVTPPMAKFGTSAVAAWASGELRETPMASCEGKLSPAIRKYGGCDPSGDAQCRWVKLVMRGILASPTLTRRYLRHQVLWWLTGKQFLVS